MLCQAALCFAVSFHVLVLGYNTLLARYGVACYGIFSYSLLSALLFFAVGRATVQEHGQEKGLKAEVG